MARREVVIVRAVILFIALVAAQTVDGEVPTSEDVATCNQQAPQAIKAGTASPTPDDHARADRVRAGSPATDSGEIRGTAIESPDPQIHGMEAEGARNAAYQAAYRSCMRRKGF